MRKNNIELFCSISYYIIKFKSIVFLWSYLLYIVLKMEGFYEEKMYIINITNCNSNSNFATCSSNNFFWVKSNPIENARLAKFSNNYIKMDIQN